MMAPRKQGLIVWISSPGGLRYAFSVAYGVGKAAVSFHVTCFLAGFHLQHLVISDTKDLGPYKDVYWQRIAEADPGFF